jgi:hypothetical protein
MTSKVVTPPTQVTPSTDLVDIFLAGSIEMGAAVNWQTDLGTILSAIPEVGIVYNPRRDDFDASQEQKISNAYFSGQVNWEADGFENSPVVFFYFDPNTQSPITLLELGNLLGRNKVITDSFPLMKPFQQSLVVYCPNGFWRQGNVEIMCYRNGIQIHRHLDAAIVALKKEIAAKYQLIQALNA